MQEKQIRDLNKLTDEELMIKSKEGDTLAYGQIVERYQKSVFNYVKNMVKNEQDAQDLAQEVFIKAHQGTVNYNPMQGLFKAWLLKIASNATWTFLSKKKRAPVSINESLADDIRGGFVFTPLEKLSEDERQQKLRDALLKLPEEQMEAIILKEFEGYKFDEIAWVLNCSISTVKSRVRYGLLKLARELKAFGV